MEDMNFFEEADLKATTIQELDEMIKRLAEKKLDLGELESQVSNLKKDMDQLKSRIDKILEVHNKKSYRTPYGLVVRTEQRFFTVPKDYESKQEFFSYLQERGEFDSLVTVNHQTLNGWANRLVEEQRELGNVDFRVPGLAEPSVRTTVSIRESKK